MRMEGEKANELWIRPRLIVLLKITHGTDHSLLPQKCGNEKILETEKIKKKDKGQH